MQISDNLSALNRAFEKAFAHTATRETLKDLLACLGEEFSCDRISIFEINPDGTCDNTYEWCSTGILSEKDLLQHLPVTWLGQWKQKFEHDEIIVIRNMEDIRASNPDIYQVFHEQQVQSVIASRMAFHGQNRGFFILENPGFGILQDAREVLPGMRYILSSLVYSDHLIHKLEKIGYSDSLTGAGNRLSLHEHLETLDHDRPVGILYCEVLGWLVDDRRPQHLKQEQMILHTGSTLEHVFDMDAIYRVAAGEFIVVSEGETEEDFHDSVEILRKLFLEQDLMVALGEHWSEKCKDTYDAMIRQAHLLLYNERRELLEEYKKDGDKKVQNLWEQMDNARISLYQGDDYFQKADAWLSQIFDENVVTIVIDVNYFKLFNDIFGRKAGNVFLESIAASILLEARQKRGIAGYLGGDNFCLMLPVREHQPEALRGFMEELSGSLKYTDGFAPAMGVYLSTNREESSSFQYDRALTALAEIKGSYTEHFRFYSEENYRSVRNNKLLLMDAKKGLENGEFLFYLQPQVHEKTGRIIGTEALVRWRCRGEVLTPSRFLEVLERSGYIFAVDCYIWEQVCIWLRSVKDRGLPMLPCSVNVSRVDFYFTDIGDHFIELVRRYGIDPFYLGVEITESAFTDNTENILRAVQKLHDAGFRIMMDDFGSGSSSLSMLHTMNVDILKTDVKFMSKKDSDSKAISIVESVISMAHMIGMLVVTEGVETQLQRDNLIALGDNYAQGFYFYHAMPVEQYEALLADPENIGEPPRKGDRIMRSHLKFRDMIQDGMLSETLLDNIIGPAAIHKMQDGNITIVQVNDLYAQMTGIGQDDEEEMTDLMRCFSEESEHEVRRIFEGADVHPLEGSVGETDFIRKDGGIVRIRAKAFLLYTCEDHKLYLTTFQDGIVD
ncbi:MAG: EAL domain-containing protein [Oscillospiraceae bacterium]|nr:EAL domain-containing protein [Oscillospiraceae bacterium]